MKVRLDEAMAARMRAANEDNLVVRGAPAAFSVALATVDGTARFLEARLGTAAAYGLIAAAADRIVERGARAQGPEARRPAPGAGLAWGGLAAGPFSRFLPKGIGFGRGGLR
jgi:hypothetical protein